MQEFIDLDHLRLIPEHEIDCLPEDSFYIPHHCVENPDSTTTKLRVVFDGSAKTNSGVSLNDVLMVGPKLQDDLWLILLRFRFHMVGLIGDIT